MNNHDNDLIELKKITDDFTFSNVRVFYEQSAIKEEKRETQAVNIDGHLFVYTNKAAAAGAATAAIVAAGTAIVKLFTDGINGTIKEAIAEITRELDYIKNLLRDVERTLERLEVLIEHQNADAAINRLIATISVCAEHINEWDEIMSGADEGLKPEIQKEIRSFLLDLQRDCRTAILYGYAAYNSVGFAMSFEIALLESGQFSIGTKKEAVARYRKFFEFLLDSNISGTISNRRVVFEQEIHALENRFTPINQVNTFVGRANWVCDGQCDVLQTITGDITNGVTGTITPVNILQDYCEHPHGHEYKGAPIKTKEMNAALSGFWANLNNFLTTYNNAVVRRRELIDKATALRAAENFVSQLVEKTTELLASWD